MVTHIPPPSPSLSSASLSTSSQQPHPSRYNPSRPSAFPPSPPSSYTYAETITPYAPSASGSRVRRGSASSSSGHHAPPSVATTSAARPSTRTRSHRRSRRGSEIDDATSAASQNAFPWFAQSGDVEIAIRDRSGRRREKKYLLHSVILAQNSRWFADQFGDAARHPADRSSTSRPQSRRSNTGDVYTAPGSRWSFEMSWNDVLGPDNEPVPLLVPSSSDRSVRPPTASSSFFRTLSRHSTSSSETSQRDADIIAAYDNMFLTFYNHTPHFDTSNVATAYVECKTLLQVATVYGVGTAAVGARCDAHLLRFRNALWKQVAKYPTSYLKLGHLARSKAIFAESLIHVVGQWPAPRRTLLRGATPDMERVVELIEDKVDEMEESRARVESKLFRLSLSTSRGERVAPLTSWTDWLAISLFRQWVAENTTPALTSILKDAPSEASRRDRSAGQIGPAIGRTYQMIAQAGDAYLDHDDLKKFLKKSREEYSRDSVRRFERRMDELKNMAADTVKPMTRSFLELSIEGDGLPYLTCTKVEEGDFKWVWKE